MTRVPNWPPKPAPAIRTLRDCIDAGVSLRSFCSSGKGHSHAVDLEALAAEGGQDTELSYDFKRSLICPECGAAGGWDQDHTPRSVGSGLRIARSISN